MQGRVAVSRRAVNIDPLVAAGRDALQSRLSALDNAPATREWTRCDEPAGSDDAAAAPLLRVMQFNILAEGLSAPAGSEVPFPESKTRDNDGGGFTDVAPSVLEWKQRRWRLLRRIIDADADVIALEECDHYFDFFAPALLHFGYEGIFAEGRSAPGLTFGFYSDGTALFYRKAKFGLLGSETINQLQPDATGQAQNCSIITATFKIAETAVTVGAAHLKAKISASNEALRLRQMQRLLQAVEEQQEQHGSAHVIVLGDFNTAPVEEGGVEPLVIPHLLAHEAPKLHSAYPLDLEYTTAKRRGTTVSKHQIDYIFLSDGLCATALMSVPPHASLGHSLLPSAAHPSDHLELACDIALA